MSERSPCPRCKREFTTYNGLGLHLHWCYRYRNLPLKLARICPDNRTPKEADDTKRIKERLADKLEALRDWT